MPTGRHVKEEKMRVVGRLADRMLALVAPQVTAAASNCWTTECFCSNHREFVRTCCIINDRLGCTPCQLNGNSC
jgi:hypothetical protein